ACTLTVTILFATIGDGVDVPEATGLRHLVITFGHTLVLGLLTVAFLNAAIRQRWNRTSQADAVVAALASWLVIAGVITAAVTEEVLRWCICGAEQRYLAVPRLDDSSNSPPCHTDKRNRHRNE